MLESIVSMFQDHDKMMLCLAAAHTTYIFNTPHIVFFKISAWSFFCVILKFLPANNFGNFLFDSLSVINTNLPLEIIVLNH